MTLFQVISTILLFLLNIVCETIWIPTLMPGGLRPDTIIPVIISLSLLSKPANGTFYGFLSGIILDAYFTRYLGMITIGYTLWGILIGVFADKYYAQNGLFVFVAGIAGYLFKELMIFFQLQIMGVRYQMDNAIIRYFLPSAIITGVIAVLFYLIYRYRHEDDVRRSKWEGMPSIYDREKKQ